VLGTSPAERARRTCAESTIRSPRQRKPSPGTTPVKCNRCVQLTDGTRKVNRALEAEALADLKEYVTAVPVNVRVRVGS
jgi:hypothetical protein